MSHQVDRVLADVDTAMSQLKNSLKGIPYRREKFKKIHDDFAKAVAALTVDVNYSRSQVPKS
ncbi:hypothetical protein JOF53_002881 [Crossiella equi]|uniref:Uncharacterized protein n=1 Tax=Crossiella equi TaxID=130796 RepID=A0ABS5ACS6_9PSEU|nr:hypothetical protein [Crossiella equi]MBP2474009.1 hypothetical protein [Crossiella equi]